LSCDTIISASKTSRVGKLRDSVACPRTQGDPVEGRNDTLQLEYLARRLQDRIPVPPSVGVKRFRRDHFLINARTNALA